MPKCKLCKKDIVSDADRRIYPLTNTCRKCLAKPVKPKPMRKELKRRDPNKPYVCKSSAKWGSIGPHKNCEAFVNGDKCNHLTYRGDRLCYYHRHMLNGNLTPIIQGVTYINSDEGQRKF